MHRHQIDTNSQCFGRAPCKPPMMMMMMMKPAGNYCAARLKYIPFNRFGSRMFATQWQRAHVYNGKRRTHARTSSAMYQMYICVYKHTNTHTHASSECCCPTDRAQFPHIARASSSLCVSRYTGREHPRTCTHELSHQKTPPKHHTIRVITAA